MSPDYFLGVDAGNSKTVALVSDAAGRVLGWGRGGGGDIYVSEEAALTAVTGAVEAALCRAGVSPAELTVGCFSLVGADWPEDFAFWERAVAARGYGEYTRVVNDALGALRAGTPEDGVAVVCGTGAAIGARRGARVWHSSFWQEPVGGAELSERTLRAVYRTELGLGPETLLTELVLAHFGCSSIEGVLHHLTARGTQPVRQRLSLSRLLLDAADAGDAVALSVVRQAGTTLGEYACVAAHRVGLERGFPLVLAGGVLRHQGSALRDTLNAHVRQRFPQVKPLAPFEPVVGALLLALETRSSPFLDYAPLTETLPPLDFFTT